MHIRQKRVRECSIRIERICGPGELRDECMHVISKELKHPAELINWERSGSPSDPASRLASRPVSRPAGDRSASQPAGQPAILIHYWIIPGALLEPFRITFGPDFGSLLGTFPGHFLVDFGSILW